MKTIATLILGGIITLFFVLVPTSFYFNFWGGLTLGIILVIITACYFLSIFGSMFER